PHILMDPGYALAMLYATLHSGPRQDLDLARAYAESAVELAETIEDPFALSFHQNGLALVELRSGRPEEALKLVTAGLELLKSEDRGQQHHAVLFANRARVLQSLGRLEEAQRDLDTAVSRDP